MADLKEFDKLLAATINAPRLSGSKVQKLASLSSELVKEDHHIVTTFFKLNASLAPASQSRISSLYVFDAIAREAKTQINKGVGTQVTKERGKGTQAGLLLKLEGVVDSWIEGLLDDGKGSVWTDGKEKSKKIVDIWSKASTFPQNCLERLLKKIQNAGSQAGPSTMPTLLKSTGRSSSSGSAGKGSTTPPHPPPTAPAATTQLGGLPPEVAKLLGISQSAIPSPPPNTILSPNANGSSSATPIIPNLDLAAILASVNKPQVSAQTHGQISPAPAKQTFNIPNLSNLVSLLPQNAISPTPTHNNHPDLEPQGGPALNASQSAALAKFASLAEAGPPMPIQNQQQIPSQNGFGQGSSVPPRTDFMGMGMSIPRRSPQKPYSDLPEPMRAEPMRANIPPPHIRDQGHVRRESDDRGNNSWGRRSSYENDGPNRRDRQRSRSPIRDRNRGFERPSDNGWGNRAGRSREVGYQQQNNQHASGPGSGSGPGFGPMQGFNDFQHSLPPNLPSQNSYNNQDQQSRHANSHSLNGIQSAQQTLPQNPSLPPRPGTNEQSQLSTTTTASTGRAPPPAWMEDRDESKGHQPISQVQNAEEEGEEDMALDEGSDDENTSKPSNNTVANPTNQEFQNNLPTSSTSNAQLQFQPNNPAQQGNHDQLQNNANPQPTENSIGLTLDTFPIAQFNPSSPDSWANLAQAWKNSMGKEPNQMELMAFLSGGMGMGMGTGN
ncbi:uncharacterized protein I206_104871 [Kwoniella pini CBS 10737]|uniref:CID domain-containing protein n=1 Tax=Kwoniella pini CBS 10737 TaxID=1296096 RepID=A0A1B9I878_9TREE|nr:uncharacterized protein I206_02411 [Kwoniella pini CBS 10737]OCF51696.1 hypothetical protein I206_02411 [Kwoniella pini CBS 10737]